MVGIEHGVDLQHIELSEEIGRRGIMAQPGGVLGGGDEAKSGTSRRRRQFGKLVLAIEMMVRKRPGQRNLAAGLRTVSKNFSGWPMPAKARYRLPAKPRLAAWPRMRLEDRPAGARRLADDGIGSKALAHLQQRAGENQLVDDASP